jgi:hypothetical protein
MKAPWLLPLLFLVPLAITQPAVAEKCNCLSYNTGECGGCADSACRGVCGAARQGGENLSASLVSR